MSAEKIEAILPTDEELIEMGYVPEKLEAFEPVEMSDEEELFKAGYRD